MRFVRCDKDIFSNGISCCLILIKFLYTSRKIKQITLVSIYSIKYTQNTYFKRLMLKAGKSLSVRYFMIKTFHTNLWTGSLIITMSFAHAFISLTKSAVMYLGTLKLKLLGSAEYMSLSQIVDGLKSPVNNHILLCEINSNNVLYHMNMSYFLWWLKCINILSE